MSRRTACAGAVALAVSAMSCSSAPDAAEERIALFDGTSFDGWRRQDSDPARDHWRIGVAARGADPKALDARPGAGELVNVTEAGTDLLTTQDLGDVDLDLEVMMARESNSGVYLMAKYEVQMKDSFGKTPIDNTDMGALYGMAQPRANAARPFGEWQHLHVIFRAPRFDDTGRKIANAVFVRVVLNDVVIHENVEVHEPFEPKRRPDVARGPLMLQGDHGPVAYRRITIAR